MENRKRYLAAIATALAEIPGIAGKPVVLTFPLAGLAGKIDKLAARCDDWDIKERTGSRGSSVRTSTI